MARTRIEVFCIYHCGFCPSRRKNSRQRSSSHLSIIGTVLLAFGSFALPIGLGKLITGLISEASGLLHTKRFPRYNLTSDLIIQEFQVRPFVMKDKRQGMRYKHVHVAE